MSWPPDEADDTVVGRAAEHWRQAEQELRGDDSDTANEGEGSQTGARQYDDGATAFAQSGKVEDAAASAAKALDDPAQAAEMKAAEEDGKKRSRGEDPAMKQ